MQRRYYISYKILDCGYADDDVFTREFRGATATEAGERFELLCIDRAGLEKGNIEVVSVEEITEQA